MCKETGDLKAASVNPDDPAFCAHWQLDGARCPRICSQLSPWLLGKMAGKTAWNEVTFADVDSTTWSMNSGSMSLSEHLAKFGPECCGSAEKTRFVAAAAAPTTTTGAPTTTTGAPQTQAYSAGAIMGPSSTLGAFIVAVAVAMHTAGNVQHDY